MFAIVFAVVFAISKQRDFATTSPPSSRPYPVGFHDKGWHKTSKLRQLEVFSYLIWLIDFDGLIGEQSVLRYRTNNCIPFKIGKQD